MTPHNFVAGRLLCFALLLVSASIFAQTSTTMSTSGNWGAATWTNTVGDVITENVTLANNVDAVIPNAQSYTIGDLSMNNGSKLTIKTTTGALNVGQSGTPKAMTASNNTVVTVEAGGILHVWGSFTSTANFQLVISGTVHIHGAAAFAGNNSNVTVNSGGKLIINGSMSANNNTNFNNNGQIQVGGSLSVGNGSNLNGSGTFQLGGSCSGPWCNNAMLPVELLYFKARNSVSHVELVWATASEVDVDFFTVEKSVDGKSFSEIGRISGMGDSKTQRTYSITDEKPAHGVSFFRLNEVTRDGKKTSISVIRNIFDGSKQVLIYPNPVMQDQPVSLSLNFHSNETHDVYVFDMRGVLMSTATWQGSESNLPLWLSAGVYIMKVVSKEFNSVQRIVVQ